MYVNVLKTSLVVCAVEFVEHSHLRMSACSGTNTHRHELNKYRSSAS